MVDIHSQSFFGQATGIIIKSPSKEEPYIFVQCIKKKANGSWEKPTQKEGKIIRLSLEEIIMALRVLNRYEEKWTTYHEFQGVKSPIAFSWEDSAKSKLWINIGDYSKMLSYSQIEFLRMLLEHILKEKIEYATHGKKLESTNTQSATVQEAPPFIMPKVEKINTSKEIQAVKKKPVNNSKEKETSKIEGQLQGETDKAVLIQLLDGKEVWFPKSTLHSEYKPQKGINQPFSIENWILKKNAVIN